MTKKIGWYHPAVESDEWDGFNDSGINYFRGNLILNLAREINQNALDAAESGSVAVEVSFDCNEVNSSDVPDLKELKENLNFCLDAAVYEGKNAQLFFKTAVAILEKPKLLVLTISDRHTRGMKGPSHNGTPFYAFTKAKGQSKKDTDTAAGSYGIGKFASYTVSAVRTIFVSTVYLDDSGKWQQLTQGKSILMSHDKEGKRKQGFGYWGLKENCKPIEGVRADLPVWLQRASSDADLHLSKGTKITILGFDATDNWADILAVSVAENFFGAIVEKKLRVNIGGKYSLNHETISDFFANSKIKEIVKELENEPEQFEDSRSYLAALTNKVEVKEEESETRDLGLCQVKILIGEGLPKKVCFLRNGMFITSNLSRLKSFSDFKEFVAVVQCKSKKAMSCSEIWNRHATTTFILISYQQKKKSGEEARP